MRLIDGDKLKEEVKGLFCPDGYKLEFIRAIDNALAVEPRIEYGTDGQPYRLFISGKITEEQAIDKLHETGWMQKHDKEMTERPTGEWIREDEVHSKCSLCGFKYADYRILFDYCPGCGADMRVKNELNRVKDELEEADND